MKQVVFSEERLKDLDSIGKELFSNEQDPRSLFYKRKLQRPKISLIKTLSLFLLLPAILLVGSIVLTNCLKLSETFAALIAVATLLAYLLLAAKPLSICIIMLYQKYAPASLRNKCRFEPSCSEYMIMAIQKYGLPKGVAKGIHRLKRCNINGGGYDFP